MKEDSSDPGYQLLTDEEIIQQVLNPSVEEDTYMEDDEDQDESTTTVSSGQAANMLEKCLEWYERQDETTASSLLLLKWMKDPAASKRYIYKNLKQLTLPSLIEISHSTP